MESCDDSALIEPMALNPGCVGSVIEFTESRILTVSVRVSIEPEPLAVDERSHFAGLPIAERDKHFPQRDGLELTASPILATGFELRNSRRDRRFQLHAFVTAVSTRAF